MGKPVLLAVDSEPDILAAMERDLSRRFAVDYRIVISDNPRPCWPSSTPTLSWQSRWQASG